AANAYLDALAHHHPHTTTIAWGLWNTPHGMAGTLGDTDLRRLSRTGLVSIEVEEGLALFDAALKAARPTVVPLPLNKAVLRRRAAAEGDHVPSVLLELAGVTSGRATAGVLQDVADGRTDGAGTARNVLAEALRSLPPHKVRERLETLVRTHAAAVLGHGSGDTIGMDRQFTDLGFDSLTAVQLRGALDTATGLRLPATLIFDHPTPGALCAHLAEQLIPSDEVLSHEAVLREIDRLESALARIHDGTAHNGQVRNRLRSLLKSWEIRDASRAGNENSPSGRDEQSNGKPHDDLEEAGLEEMLGIIDEELGLS
ncbi:beta-ketoacyl reductase, partial [Streptomyces sp. NPDC001508]|uniref:beta-ketoacyl reductase n=1 Tax=Streptomyces sp. NPDC001508 TaxID=3154656 RepID=UPI00332C5616